MPYYRIIVFLKHKKPVVAIRQYEMTNIETVYMMCYRKADSHYRGIFEDIEVQMLSKISTAVKNFIHAQQKKVR